MIGRRRVGEIVNLTCSLSMSEFGASEGWWPTLSAPSVSIPSVSLTLSFAPTIAPTVEGTTHRYLCCCHDIVFEHGVLIASLEQFIDQSRRLQSERESKNCVLGRIAYLIAYNTVF